MSKYVPDTESITQLLRSHSTLLELPKGQIIHIPGDIDHSLYFIESGLVRFVLNSEEGDEKILYSLSDGWFFNEESLWGEEEITTQIYCVEASTLLKIDRSLLLKLQANPNFNKALLQSSISKKEMLQKEVENISFHTCKQRILMMFTQERDMSKLYDQNWYDLKMRYTHQDLASMIGANRVTVSKLITELCESGHLRTINRKIQIHRNAIKKKEGKV